jgi:hypothetical protein
VDTGETVDFNIRWRENAEGTVLRANHEVGPLELADTDIVSVSHGIVNAMQSISRGGGSAVVNGQRQPFR